MRMIPPAISNAGSVIPKKTKDKTAGKRESGQYDETCNRRFHSQLSPFDVSSIGRNHQKRGQRGEWIDQKEHRSKRHDKKLNTGRPEKVRHLLVRSRRIRILVISRFRDL